MARYNRDIKYTARDFSTLKTQLTEFAKNYFPNTIKDFSESSPSTMFIEMAAYVGDVLSYYTDYALKENMIHRAQDRSNVIALAQTLGYKPKITTPAQCKVTMYIQIPSTGTGVNVKPDWDYAPRVERGAVLSTTTGTKFTTDAAVDFAFSSSNDPTGLEVYSSNESTGLPELYILTKQVLATSGEQLSATLDVGSAAEYLRYTIATENVQSVDSIVDGDGMEWTEVPYLACDTVFDESVNDVANDPTMTADQINTPYILRLKTTKRRFITRVNSDNKIDIIFGAGVSNSEDEDIIPNPDNIGSALPGGINKLDQSFDPSNFLYTNTYGQAPSNTTLTIKYTKGYGLTGNVVATDISKVDSKTITYKPSSTLISGTKTTVDNSLEVTNLEAATGGMGAESIEQIRQNAMGYFQAQNRVVTKEDYVVRSLSMPSKFGTIAKAYIASDEQMLEGEISADNPLAVNLYVLTYNRNKKLTTVSSAGKENLKTYLSQYRMLTDAINIKDGYIVNIGIDFDITVLPGNNTNAVLVQCINVLKQMFAIDKYSFSSAIYIKDIYLALANVKGVQSVVNVNVYNKFGADNGYSQYTYNIDNATYKDVIYPSLDPSVFEVKFPNEDIKGKVVAY